MNRAKQEKWHGKIALLAFRKNNVFWNEVPFNFLQNDTWQAA